MMSDGSFHYKIRALDKKGSRKIPSLRLSWTKAVADFILAHPDIAGVRSFLSFGG